MDTTEQRERAEKAARLRKRVHDDLLRRDPNKYGRWLRDLEGGRSFVRKGAALLRQKLLPRALDRLELTDTLYAVMRLVDDIADADAPLPMGWPSATAYLEHLLDFVRTRCPSDDEMVYLLGYVLDLGYELGMDLREGIAFVLLALLFDARRREAGTLVIVPRTQLDGNYFLLDEKGVIGLCLTVLGESPESFGTISLLGVATRKMYTLRDLREDMRKSLCNVPYEDFRTFDMYVPEVSSEDALRRWYDSGPTRAWRAAEARRGIELYDAYDRKREGLDLYWFTPIILNRLYERSTLAGLEGELTAA
jgi:hypothetical protein